MRVPPSTSSTSARSPRVGERAKCTYVWYIKSVIENHASPMRPQSPFAVSHYCQRAPRGGHICGEVERETDQIRAQSAITTDTHSSPRAIQCKKRWRWQKVVFHNGFSKTTVAYFLFSFFFSSCAQVCVLHSILLVHLLRTVTYYHLPRTLTRVRS